MSCPRTNPLLYLPTVELNVVSRRPFHNKIFPIRLRIVENNFSQPFFFTGAYAPPKKNQKSFDRGYFSNKSFLGSSFKKITAVKTFLVLFWRRVSAGKKEQMDLENGTPSNSRRVYCVRTLTFLTTFTNFATWFIINEYECNRLVSIVLLILFLINVLYTVVFMAMQKCSSDHCRAWPTWIQEVLIIQLIQSGIFWSLMTFLTLVRCVLFYRR